MAAAAEKRTPKSESLTIRLDPKTRFILEFVAKLRGQPLTTVVERFITDGASQIALGYDDQRTWRDFWDVSEGVRSLLMAKEPALYPTYEEERRLAFTRQFAMFFWTGSKQDTPNRAFLDVLWPRIDEFTSMHEAKKATDYFATGKAMLAALKDAGFKGPEYPPGANKPLPTARESFSADLDDEIPF